MKYLVCKLEMTPRGALHRPRTRPIDASQKFTNKTEAIRFARGQPLFVLSVIDIGREGIALYGPFKIVWPKSNH